MEATATEARIEELSKVIDAIHHANIVYWRSKDRTREAIAEYHRRQRRLGAIRREIAQRIGACYGFRNTA